MMIKKILLFSIIICFYSCEQLIEGEDISNETLTVSAPSNNVTITSAYINFSWEVLDYADTYQLQIAKPNFESSPEIVDDTLISIANFTKNLSPGNYQ